MDCRELCINITLNKVGLYHHAIYDKSMQGLEEGIDIQNNNFRNKFMTFRICVQEKRVYNQHRHPGKSIKMQEKSSKNKNVKERKTLKGKTFLNVNN